MAPATGPQLDIMYRILAALTNEGIEYKSSTDFFNDLLTNLEPFYPFLKDRSGAAWMQAVLGTGSMPKPGPRKIKHYIEAGVDHTLATDSERIAGIDVRTPCGYISGNQQTPPLEEKSFFEMFKSRWSPILFTPLDLELAARVIAARRSINDHREPHDDAFWASVQKRYHDTFPRFLRHSAGSRAGYFFPRKDFEATYADKYKGKIDMWLRTDEDVDARVTPDIIMSRFAM
ncbi:hypothetical protein CcaverHIS002_0101810 [Cutaneotrichosporon cavernicola]|nr:hypothetical protein CcaverHIS002_0101810 [Cutaneotrichosporon cavernicola]